MNKATHELQKFLDNTLAKLSTDLRFVGLAVAGSWITKNTDEFSDLDLILVCEDAPYEGVMAERMAIAESLGSLAAAFTGEHVGEPRLIICLYDNPVLHVDLKFIKLVDLEHRIEDPIIVWERDARLSKKMNQSVASHPMPNLQWIEDRFWVWVHYAATKIGRGELYEVLDFIAFLRGNVLGPLSLVKHGQLPRGSRRLETLAPQNATEFLATVATHDQSSCLAAVKACIHLYQKLREELGDGNLKRNAKAEALSIGYLQSLKIKEA